VNTNLIIGDKGIIRQVSRGLGVVSRGAALIMVLFITTGVVGRYVFNKPILGDIEVVEWLMLIIVGAGLAFTQAEDGHISMDILVGRWPARRQAAVDIVHYTIATAILVFVGWRLFSAGAMSFQGGEGSEILAIPVFPFKYFLGACYIVWSLETLHRLIKSVNIVRGHKER